MSTMFTRGENPLRADKLNQAFSERVSRDGDTMLGMLQLARDPVAALDAATKQYVDSRSSFVGPTSGPIILTTNTPIGLDTAALGSVPNMFMRSDGGAVIFHADGWNEFTPSAFRGINFKVFGNGGADEYWGVTGGPNGNGATLKVYSVSGGWPCIGSILASNEGQLMLGNDNGTVLNIQGPTGALTKNYLLLSGGGPGLPVTLSVVGETNGDMELVANGGGNVYIGNDNYTGTSFATLAVGGLTADQVNGFRMAGTPTGIGPVLSAVGNDPDIAFVILPKGGGALQGSAGGNTRGANAVDWQRPRATTTQVASGNASAVGGGNSNTASVDYTVVGGGFQNNADGYASVIPGGMRAWARGQHGWFGWAGQIMQGVQEGDAQGSWRLLLGVTTGGAAVRLTSDRAAINTVAPNINSVLVGNDRAVAMSIKLVGMDQTATTTRSNAYFNEILMSKDALGGSVVNLGTARTLGVDIPTVAITVGAEGLLSVVVTPANTNTWHFLAKLSCAEVY